jgi:putative restriction endonuclease
VDDTGYWLAKFARLRIDTASNAPHKPLLLLVAHDLALSKNAHWLFDAGLWSIDDDYRVLVVADRFDEECPDQKPLASYAGNRLRLPADERIWPARANLAWHREHKFVA